MKKTFLRLDLGMPDHQSGLLTNIPKCQLWVGDTENIIVAFSHAWLILIELI